MERVKYIFILILLMAGTSGFVQAADLNTPDTIESARAATRNNVKNPSENKIVANSNRTSASIKTDDKNSSTPARLSTRQKTNIVPAKTPSKNSRTVSTRNSGIGPQDISGAITNRAAIRNIETRTDTQQQTPATISRSAVRGTASKITPATRNGISKARTANDDKADTQPAQKNDADVATKKTEPKTPTRNYTNCRDTYNQCMDEFCATKDTQLKRCACSSRMHDFDSVKVKMSKVETSMQDFNQQLLTVNMDKEDAAAINTATVGELAYQETEDKTASQKILDEISTKLKKSMEDTNESKNMSAINLSIDTDSAFDNIDSLFGASTTTKEGTELYNAALPVCRDIAAEVCDEDSADIVESAYQMAIEKDCNTVANIYAGLETQALEKSLEGSALLDMSRLNNYQTRNSDDILTCKKKMLEMLSDTSVCGTDLTKCLDYSGKYIDPSTGQAILTSELYQLTNMIKRPTGSDEWSKQTGNEMFVSFLNAKKEYLEPAMANCENISTRVWDDFIEDALAQIKLAQGQKLESMRQSCTSLTTTCLAGASTDLSDFDTRALSVFGVYADKTANEICSGIKNACTALMETSSDSDDWQNGMTKIEDDKTYEQIMTTCMQIGKNCIVQNCSAISGNFGLCFEQTDVQRQNVLNRQLCWNEVQKCILDASLEKIDRIFTSHSSDFAFDLIYGGTWGVRVLNSDPTNPYYELLSTNNPNYKYLTSHCSANDQLCQMTEAIWGHCERDVSYPIDICPNNPNDNTQIGVPYPTTGICGYKKGISDYIENPSETKFGRNKIIIPQSTETLLSWFAENTATDKDDLSCYASECQAGTIPVYTLGNVTARKPFCVLPESMTSDGVSVPTDEPLFYIVDNVNDSLDWTNYCPPDSKDEFGNCCVNGVKSVDNFNINATSGYFGTTGTTAKICVPNATATTQFVAAYTLPSNGFNFLVCVDATGPVTPTDAQQTAGWPSGQTLNCPGGRFIVIHKPSGTYRNPGPGYTVISGQTLPDEPKNYYNISNALRCFFNFNTTSWTSNPLCNKIIGRPVNETNNLFIEY